VSSQRTGENTQLEYERRLAGGTSRRANAEELLSELKRLLESSGRPPFAPQPASPSASIVSATPSTAAKPQLSADFAKAHEGADDLSADGSLKRRRADLRDTYGQHQELTRESTHLRSRRRRLAVSGFALGFAALAAAGLALKPAGPWSKSPLSVVPRQAQNDVQPPGAESVVASSDVGGLMKDRGLPDQMQVGSTEAGINAKESTPTTSAAIDAQRPAEGPNAPPVATTVDTRASASAAAGSALTASQTAGLEPVRSVVVRPDGTPIARISTNSADSTSPGETPTPHTEAATTAGIRADSARPPATKVDLPATPNASKKSVRKSVAKSGKATAGAMAEAAKQPLSPMQQEKAVKSPTAPAVTDPIAPIAAAPAAPTTPSTFAAQSVRQLTHAFVYLTHLPVALVQHATDPNSEAR
jgi:hypothetical protein